MNFSTTGVWPGAEPREAASAAYADAGLPALPQVAQPALGGTRWALDELHTAVGLIELPLDIAAGRWRLARGDGRDQRRARSHTAQTLDAVEEYAAGCEAPTLVSLPGPWHVLRRLALPSGAPALADVGAVRDVLQAYTFGVAEHLAAVQRRTGQSPRVRVREGHLDDILTGAVPTDSGLRTLPALPDAAVMTGLKSFLARCGAEPLLHVPKLGAVRVRGRELGHSELLRSAGVRGIIVDLPRPSARQWEALGEWVDAGCEAWLAFPPNLPASLCQTLGLVWEPWQQIGMSRASAAHFGVLTGLREPGAAGLLPESADPAQARRHMEQAARIYSALKEEQ